MYFTTQEQRVRRLEFPVLPVYITIDELFDKKVDNIFSSVFQVNTVIV